MWCCVRAKLCVDISSSGMRLRDCQDVCLPVGCLLTSESLELPRAALSRHALNPFQVLQQSVCIRSIKMPFNASALLLALHFLPLSRLLHFPFCLYSTHTCHLFTSLPLSQTSCGAGHGWMVYWQSDDADESSSVRNDVETLFCLHLAGTSFHFTSQRIVPEFTLASVRLKTAIVKCSHVFCFVLYCIFFLH